MWKSETREMEKLFESPKTQTFFIKYILPPGWLLFCGYKLFPLLEYRDQIKPETWLINLAFLGIPFVVFMFIAIRLKHIEVMEERIGVSNFRENTIIEYGFVEGAYQIFGTNPAMISIAFRETALIPWQKILVLSGGRGGISGLFKESEMVKYISRKVDQSPLGQYRVLQNKVQSKAAILARGIITALGMLFLVLLVTGGLDEFINPLRR